MESMTPCAQQNEVGSTKHDGGRLMLATLPTRKELEVPAPTDWTLPAYHRMQSRNLAAQVPYEESALHEEMAKLDKLLDFERSLLLAMDFNASDVQEKAKTAYDYKINFLKLLLDRIDPELMETDDFVVLARNALKRYDINTESRVWRKLPSLRAMLHRVVREDVLTRPNFAEHYHTAHMCLIVALSEKLANLEGSGMEWFDIYLNHVCIGWNFNAESQKLDPIFGWEPPIEPGQGSYNNISSRSEVHFPSSDHITVDKVAEIEHVLLQRIQELEAAKSAAVEENYGWIPCIYDGINVER